SPRNVLMWGCALAIGAGFLLAPLLGGGSLLLVGVFLSMALLLMGFVYGPLGAWLPGLFPARVRYTGASIAFNIGGVLGGGLTPLIAEQLVTKGGLPLVGAYLSAAAALSLVGLLLLRRTAET
ncbi:MAG: MFS transporter, partial [Pseudomonadota bacterium]